MENKSILITGGSGLIGRTLTGILLSKGYNVSHLSRTKNSFPGVKNFLWNPGREIIDREAFKDIDGLVHLAGANIGEKRWTGSRKNEIVKSRVDSSELLFEKIKEKPGRLRVFISASAVGYYGSVTTDKIFQEEDLAGTDFLGHTCKLWENSADHFLQAGIKVIKIRTGVVMDKKDSALSKMMASGRFGFLVKTGSGKQYMPWIHISDLCNIYLKAIEDENMSGPYNAVAPCHVTHNEFMAILGKVMHTPVFPVPVPAFLLKTVLGEMSDVVLKGSRVSAEKIIASGYTFIFPDIEKALIDVLTK